MFILRNQNTSWLFDNSNDGNIDRQKSLCRFKIIQITKACRWRA